MRTTSPLLFLLFAALFPALAQTTTNFTFDVILTETPRTAENIFVVSGSGSAAPLGNAALRISGIVALHNTDFVPPVQVTARLYFNALDSFGASFTVNDVNLLSAPPYTLSAAAITGGTGAYAGATGSLTLNVAATTTGSGTVTVGGKTTQFTLTNFHGSIGCPGCERDYSGGTLTGTVTPGGNVTGTYREDNTQSRTDPSQRSFAMITIAFNATDSFNLYLGADPAISIVSGGTGAYAGATGSFTSTSMTQVSADSTEVKGTGTITTAAPAAPIITQVKTAFGSFEIANNTWLQINGTNLAPANTPSTGVEWSNAPEFASGKMPTRLGAIDGVTVNGKPGYIYFYCSAATNPNCATDQINVLAPLFDGTNGLVQVVVTRNGVASAPFIVSKYGLSPTLPLFDVQGHVVARHLDFSLMGPTALFPPLTTPAKPGETLILVAYGLGQPTGTTLTEGSSTQVGSLPSVPRCWISGFQASVAAALISPGLYQLNVTVPSQVTSGDNPISCVYPGVPSFPGSLIAVQ